MLSSQHQVVASPPAALAPPPPAAAARCRSSPWRKAACAFAACTTSSSARLKWPSASLRDGATSDPTQCSGREGWATSSYSPSKSPPAAVELGAAAAALHAGRSPAVGKAQQQAREVGNMQHG